MNNVGNILRKSLLKRQDSINNFKMKKEAFLRQKEQIVKDIEEARSLWKKTIEQLPDQEFRQ